MKKTTIISIILLCIFFFAIGIISANCVHKNNNYHDNYTEYSTYENITINVYHDYNEKNLQLYLENLKTISKKLTKNCKNIYFTNENLTKKFDLNISTQIVAITYGDDIYINTNYYGDDVLTHEMFHVFDYCNNWISESKTFKELYNEYKNEIEISPGNNETINEFFATYGEMFVLNSQNLTKNKLFDFFSDLDI